MTDTASFRFGSLGQIHMALGDAVIAPGYTSHRLMFPITVTGTWLNPEDATANAPTMLFGAAWTGLPNYRWLASVQPQVLTVRGYAASEELVIDLSDDQLVALERARGENDVVLNLKLQATLLLPVRDVHPVASEEARVRIARGRWSELLDQVGTEVGITLRVPSPLTDAALQSLPATSADDAASMTQATARLRQARAELRDHQWEPCIATCRQVLENLGRLVAMPPAKQVFETRPEARTQDQRWAAIYHDVKRMANAAHHDDETTTGFTWSRADADAVLAATAGLLVRYTSDR